MNERTVGVLVVCAVTIGVIGAFRGMDQQPASVTRMARISVAPESIPLVTGDETISEIFTKAGCAVCHAIPGVAGAVGRVGPPLLLGETGIGRLQDPSYKGLAKTVHEYVVESVVEPGVYVVPGYPPNTMPTWYGTKLSALALEKVAAYLERQTDQSSGIRN